MCCLKSYASNVLPFDEWQVNRNKTSGQQARRHIHTGLNGWKHQSSFPKNVLTVKCGLKYAFIFPFFPTFQLKMKETLKNCNSCSLYQGCVSLSVAAETRLKPFEGVHAQATLPADWRTSFRRSGSHKLLPPGTLRFSGSKFINFV